MVRVSRRDRRAAGAKSFDPQCPDFDNILGELPTYRPSMWGQAWAGTALTLSGIL